VNVIVASDKAGLERQIADLTRQTDVPSENLIYTYAAGESVEAQDMIESMKSVEALTHKHKKIVIASKGEINSYMNLGNGQYAFFIPAEGHSPLKRDIKVTVIGQTAPAFKTYLEGAFPGLIDFIKSPWEALKRLYMSMRMAEVAA